MERQPVRIQLTRTPLVSDGHPSKIETQIFYCVAADDTGAPFYEDDIVKKLVVVTADLSVIPSTSLRKCIGKDGLRYYDLKYEIEITYYSASTKYELIYNRKNYGTVHAEQV
ncbi:hypothetical protein MMC13_005296 [Lambiella insularis]|nr:hypothetical protein [Lambiella insularis]